MTLHLMDYGILGLHLYGSAELNFPYGCFWAVALYSLRDTQPAKLQTLLVYSHNEVHYWIICIGFIVVFCFGWTFSLFVWYQLPQGSIVSTHMQPFFPPSISPSARPLRLTYSSINVKECSSVCDVCFLVPVRFQTLIALRANAVFCIAFSECIYI